MMQGARQETREIEQVSRSRRTQLAIAATLVVLPAVFFYTILFLLSSSLPVQDDYEMILMFLNRVIVLHGFYAKASYFIGAQFNEYKIFFVHAVAWLQVVLTGHVEFKILCAIGNGFVVLLAILLWAMFLPGHKDVVSKLMLFVPISWLVFQLHYAETLNWAGPGLQNIPVVPFSLGAFYFLMRSSRRAYYGAVACLVLAIAASGNGLIIVLLGALILARRKLYARMTGWIAVSAGCIAAYAYHYSFNSSQSPVHNSIFATLLHARPMFFMGFLGNAFASPFQSKAYVRICPVLGIILSTFLLFLAFRGYFRRNPMIGYSILFVLLTAAGVTGMRSEFGIRESIASRYGIYSTLLLIFAWFAIVEEFLLPTSARLRRQVLTGTIAVVMLFSLQMDRWGWRYLRHRNYEAVAGMKAFEHSASSETPVGPVLPRPHQMERIDELDRHALTALQDSIRLGIYQPPQF